MKYSLTLLMLFACTIMHAQNKVTDLYHLHPKAGVDEGYSLIYGNFIQRLAFSSGGFKQEIKLRETSTGNLYSFNVKSSMRSRKENLFCIEIPPGEYEIVQYFYTKSQWYGSTTYWEPVYKGKKASELKKQKITTDSLLRYRFKLEGNNIYYVGTWNFDDELVQFTNDKAETDAEISKKYTLLDFATAITVLPE